MRHARTIWPRVSPGTSVCSRVASVRAASSTNVSFSIISDCGATVEQFRASQFGDIVGSSKVSSTVSGIERRACT